MQNVIFIVILVLLQALMFNRIHIFDVATPLVYVYYVIRIPRDVRLWLSLVVCFVIGIFIDMFSNTPGLAASSLTLLAFLRPKILELFLRKEDPEDLVPSLRAMNFGRFLLYATIIILLYCIIFFTLEVFTLTHWYEWFLNVSGSFVITIVLILTAESVRK